jgi:hypothetical protein
MMSGDLRIMDKQMKTIIALLVFSLVLSTGLGYYFGTISSPQQNTTAATSVGSPGQTSPYVLSLVITTNNMFNASVGEQPAYYVVGPNGLQSSANVTLPANRLIELVITNYDTGNATPVSPQYDNVSGTVSGSMEVVSNNGMNSSEGASGIAISGMQTVSSLPPAVISHTFTVPGLNLNIPVAANSTVVAYFMTGSPGNYLWTCMTPCGSGSSGLGGAMETPGWMSGSIAVA